eukprot:jgi/Chrpa1/23792/Chrysochromulina_OHIO_Genome00023873-RA
MTKLSKGGSGAKLDAGPLVALVGRFSSVAFAMITEHRELHGAAGGTGTGAGGAGAGAGAGAGGGSSAGEVITVWALTAQLLHALVCHERLRIDLERAIADEYSCAAVTSSDISRLARASSASSSASLSAVPKTPQLVYRTHEAICVRVRPFYVARWDQAASSRRHRCRPSSPCMPRSRASVWLNNKELPGTGRPRAPRVGIDKPDQLAVCFVIRGLPHGKPIAIAAAAFDAAGDVIGGIGGMTREIVTALPLPRPLLWAHFARHAYQLGAPMLVRRVLTEVQKAIHAITPRSASAMAVAALEQLHEAQQLVLSMQLALTIDDAPLAASAVQAVCTALTPLLRPMCTCSPGMVVYRLQGLDGVATVPIVE